MRFCIRFITLFFITLNFAGHSQQPIMYNYTTEDGISGNEVFDVIQDNRGYIWIATNNGICKFNGKNFVSFYSKDGLPDNSVINFYKEDSGKIWILTYKNELAYLNNDKIIQYEYNKLVKKFERIEGYCIQSFCVDNDDIYLGMFEESLIKINKFGKPEKLQKLKETGIFVQEINSDKLAYTQKLRRFKTFEIFLSLKDTSYIKNFNCEKNVSTDKFKFLKKDNYLIIAQGNILYILKDNKFFDQHNFDSKITKLKKDKNGNLLVCTYKNGIYFYPFKKIKSPAKYHFLNGYTITSVYQDNESGYWIPTLNNGVFHIPSLAFRTIEFNDKMKDRHIGNITMGKSELWFTGISGHVGYIDQDGVKVEDFSDINSSDISDIAFDSEENKIWIAYDGGMYFLANFNKKTFQSYVRGDLPSMKEFVNRFLHIHLKSILIENNLLILGASSTLFAFKKNGNTLSVVTEVPLAVNAIALGKSSSDIWFGNRDGLHLFKKDSVYRNFSKDKIINKRVIDLKYDKKIKGLWVATKDTGIYLLKRNKIQTISTSNGLSGNNITAFCIKDNRLWVGTTKGLDQLIIKDYEEFDVEIQHFNENKGLISNIINDIAANDSIVYVAGNKGISYFNYKEIKKNNTTPPLFLKSIQINNRDTSIQDHYILSNTENNIRIDFDGLNYSSPKEVKYSYILEGVHSEWQTTYSNYLEFLLLPPGEYSLVLYAVNEDGVKSKQPAEIRFFVKAPFYATWWFIGLMAVITVLLIFSFFKYRMNELIKRNKLERNLLKERQNALGHQINPHFISNTLSSIQLYMYKRDKVATSVYLDKFALLMRNTLYNSQNQFILLTKEINALKNYMELEQLAYENKFDFHVHIFESENIDSALIPPFLIQPFLENAVLHGIKHKKGQGIISMNVKCYENYIICEIIDNGIGRKAAILINKGMKNSHVSLGGKISENRFNLLNKLYNNKLSIKYFDLENDDNDVLGTKVILTIPVFYNY